jgi:hypothetical protein
LLLLRRLLTQAQQSAVETSLLEQAHQNGYANAAVHFVPLQGNTVTGAGVWLQGPSPETFDEPKRLGLDRVVFNTPFPRTNHWALSVNVGTIEREVDKRWLSGEIPRHYNSNGSPCFSADCDIDIDGVNVYFNDLDFPFNPRRDRMYTLVSGKYTPAFPDITFLVVTTDVFTTVDGKVQITPSTDVQKDTNILNVLTGIFLLLGAIYAASFGVGAGMVPFLAGAVFGTEDVIVNLVDPNGFPGVGQFVVDNFFPSTITIPGIPTLELDYHLFEVDGATITGSGTFSLGSFPRGLREPGAVV